MSDLVPVDAYALCRLPEERGSLVHVQWRSSPTVTGRCWIDENIMKQNWRKLQEPDLDLCFIRKGKTLPGEEQVWHLKADEFFIKQGQEKTGGGDAPKGDIQTFLTSFKALVREQKKLAKKNSTKKELSDKSQVH